MPRTPHFKAVVILGNAIVRRTSQIEKVDETGIPPGILPAAAALVKWDTAKHTVKANYQLVVSGQAKQIGCPLSGGKCNPETATSVGEAKEKEKT